VKQVYKITYPTGKIYIGKQSYVSVRYMGSPNKDLLNADFASLPDDVRLDYTIRKQILWESGTASEEELSAMEVELIREHRSRNGVSMPPSEAWLTYDYLTVVQKTQLEMTIHRSADFSHTTGML
jgi:hypothetical protein